MKQMRIADFMDDPRWAEFIPSCEEVPVRRSAVAHEDCSPLEVDYVASMLMPGGILGCGMDGYEERPGQLDMLRAVVRAFNAREHLIVEAGTGVGKSFAYVVPALLWGHLNKSPVVVSTATRNLQTQLARHDIPIAAAAIEKELGEPVKTALLKGRANYLCLNALDEINHDGFYALGTDEQADFETLVDWLHATSDGDLDTIDIPYSRSKLSCSGEDCAGVRCQFRKKCFVQKARARAQEADLVVANHALVFSEAQSQSGILPAYSRIIFDEAHDLESVATDFFSSVFSRKSLDLLLGRISRKGRSGRKQRGILSRLAHYCDNGTFGTGPLHETMKELSLKLELARREAETRGYALLEVAARLFSPDRARQRIRYRVVKSQLDGSPRRQFALQGLFADYNPAQWDETALDTAKTRFENSLAVIVNILVSCAQTLKDVSDGEPTLEFGDLEGQLVDLATEIRSYKLSSNFVLSGDSAQYVFWAERESNPKPVRDETDVSLIAAPLSVAETLHELFHDTKDSVVFASATLRVRGKFTYCAKRLGMSLVEGDRVRTCLAASPFDYLRQSLTLAVDFLPPPDSSPNAFAADAADFILKIFTVTGGRGLVLFTAYEMMRTMRDLLQSAFAASGLVLLVQGDNTTREAMVERLKHPGGEKVVLFGTQSFWEGVDVPGDALSCVVIARLPFPQKTDPVFEARCDAISEAGGVPFTEYVMPETEIKLRQGVGRLIRKKDDCGAVVVLDSRLAVKNYGAMLRQSLPGSVLVAHTAEDALGRIDEFMNRRIV